MVTLTIRSRKSEENQEKPEEIRILISVINKGELQAQLRGICICRIITLTQGCTHFVCGLIITEEITCLLNVSDG